MRYSFSTLLQAVVLGGGFVTANLAGLISGRFAYGLPVPAEGSGPKYEFHSYKNEDGSSGGAIVCGYRYEAPWILPFNLLANGGLAVLIFRTIRKSMQDDERRIRAFEARKKVHNGA